MSTTQQPSQRVLYPCFYNSENGQLLVCANDSNPGQRCPEGFTRVGETVNCTRNPSVHMATEQAPIATIQSTPNTYPGTNPILTTPRSGGVETSIFVMAIMAFMVLSSVFVFFRNPNQE